VIRIEKGVPIPQSGDNRPRKYPYREMGIGDSFHVVGGKDARDRIGASSRSYAERHEGFAFTIRREGNGFRIWRVEPKAASRVVKARFANGGAA